MKISKTNRQKIKQVIFTSLLIVSILFAPWRLIEAANTHSADFESTSSQYFSITDAAQTGLDLTGDWTVTFWINFESLPGTNEIDGIMEKWEGPSDRQYVMGFYNNAGTYQIYYADSAAGAGDVKSGTATFDTALTTGVWYHIALVRTAAAGSVAVYLATEASDAHDQEGSTITGLNTSTKNGTDTLTIGFNPSNGTDYLDGKVDDFRVYSATKTTTELDADMNQELVGNESGLVAYWTFNNDALDTTANNNDLTNNNSITYSTTIPDWSTGGGAAVILQDNSQVIMTGI